MRRSIKLNVVSTLILQVVSIVYGLLIPNLLIRNFGSDLNGLVSSIRHFTSVLVIVEAGIGLNSIASLYGPISKKQDYIVSNILGETKKLYIKSAFLFFILLCSLMIVYPFLVVSEYKWFIIVFLIFATGFSPMIDMIFASHITVLLRGDNKEYIISITNTIILLINLFLGYILISYNYSVLVVFFALSISYIIRPIVYNIYFKKKYHFRVLNLESFIDKSQQKSSMVHQVATLVLNNTDILLITIFFSLLEVSIYSVYLLIFSGVSRIISIFNNGLVATFGRVIAEKNLNKLGIYYGVYEFLYYSIISILYSITVIVFLPFMRVYSSDFTDGNYINFIFLALFFLAEFLNKLRIPSNTLVLASGHFSETRKPAIIEMSLNISASLIGIYLLGFYGVLVGTVIAFAYRSVQFMLYTSKKVLYRKPSISLLRASYFLVLAGVIIYLLKDGLMYNPKNYYEWIIYSMKISLFVLSLYIIPTFFLMRKNISNLFRILKKLKSIE